MDPGEVILLDLKPAKIAVLLTSAAQLFILLLLFVLGVWLVTSTTAPPWGVRLACICVPLALAVLAWQAVKLDVQVFTLTDRRIASRWGVFRTNTIEARLSRVQHVVLTRSLLQRFLGLGTISAVTAGNDQVNILWLHIKHPQRRLSQIQAALGKAALDPALAPAEAPRPPAPPIRSPMPSSSPPPRPPILGLAGGIGAGKSQVAKVFQQLGCYVVDSDARAKAALDRPDVRDTLVAWWGPSILTADNRVDRSAVAHVIFTDPEQRRRLEGLVHPIIRQDRAELVKEAHRFWAKAVIVDAPLLFEAGVDQECDEVVFVDAPYEDRVNRVLTTRGWTRTELDRREASQMPLEEKRARCRFHIQNTGEIADLVGPARAILESVFAARSQQDSSRASPPGAESSPDAPPAQGRTG